MPGIFVFAVVGHTTFDKPTREALAKELAKRYARGEE